MTSDTSESVDAADDDSDTGSCRHLEYRTEADEQSFETARAYCTVVDAFVQPMRADICNARYDLDPERDCEWYE